MPQKASWICIIGLSGIAGAAVLGLTALLCNKCVQPRHVQAAVTPDASVPVDATASPTTMTADNLSVSPCIDPGCRRLLNVSIMLASNKKENVRVECMFYDMARPDRYLVRKQQWFKTVPHMTVGGILTAELDNVQSTKLSVNALVGVKCDLVPLPELDVDDTTQVP